MNVGTDGSSNRNSEYPYKLVIEAFERIYLAVLVPDCSYSVETVKSWRESLDK